MRGRASTHCLGYIAGNGAVSDITQAMGSMDIHCSATGIPTLGPPGSFFGAGIASAVGVGSTSAEHQEDIVQFSRLHQQLHQSRRPGTAKTAQSGDSRGSHSPSSPAVTPIRIDKSHYSLRVRTRARLPILILCALRDSSSHTHLAGLACTCNTPNLGFRPISGHFVSNFMNQYVDHHNLLCIPRHEYPFRECTFARYVDIKVTPLTI
jgi:hypothetical protein